MLPSLKTADVGSPAADISHDNARLLLIFGQYGLTAGQRLKDEVLNIYADAADALYQVLNGGYGRSNNMCLHIKSETMHAYRVL